MDYDATESSGLPRQKPSTQLLAYLLNNWDRRVYPTLQRFMVRYVFQLDYEEPITREVFDGIYRMLRDFRSLKTHRFPSPYEYIKKDISNSFIKEALVFQSYYEVALQQSILVSITDEVEPLTALDTVIALSDLIELTS